MSGPGGLDGLARWDARGHTQTHLHSRWGTPELNGPPRPDGGREVARAARARGAPSARLAARRQSPPRPRAFRIPRPSAVPLYVLGISYSRVICRAKMGSRSNLAWWTFTARHNINVVGAEHGPTMMLVHGFGCDQNLWRLVVDRAWSQTSVSSSSTSSGRDCRTQARGTRPSTPRRRAMPADILDIVDELDLRDVVFVGHSVSAMIGALATITDPVPIRQAGPADAVTALHRRRRLSRRILEADIDELLESLEQNYLGWSRAMAPVIMGTPDRPELAGRIGRRPSAAPTRNTPACSPAPHSCPTIARTSRAISLPTLVIECAQDAIAPREVGAYVHAQISRQPNSSPWTQPDTARTSAPRRPPPAAIAAFARST